MTYAAPLLSSIRNRVRIRIKVKSRNQISIKDVEAHIGTKEAHNGGVEANPDATLILTTENLDPYKSEKHIKTLRHTANWQGYCATPCAKPVNVATPHLFQQWKTR